MKIRVSCLRRLVKEGIDGRKFLRERPWSVEHTFSMSGGDAEDSEGDAPDGFAIIIRGENGREARVVVDSYWNPQAGDQSGNSLKWEIDGETVESTYVPTRFDDGSEQKIIVSNSPIKGLLMISHCKKNEVPIVHMVVENPFEEQEDLEFESEPIGGGDVDVEMTGATNI